MTVSVSLSQIQNMSSANETAAGADKLVRNPIHFTEAFRRAKRNALIWAAAVILIAIGISEGKDIEFVGVVRGLAIPPELALGGAFIVMLLMCVGYYRADVALGFLNTNAAIEKRDGEFQEVLFQLKGAMEDIREKMFSNSTALQIIRDAVEREYPEGSPTPAALTEALEATLDQIGHKFDAVGRDVHRYFADHAGSANQTDIMRFLRENEREIRDLVEGLQRMDTGLAKFADNYENRFEKVLEEQRSVENRVNALFDQVGAFGSMLDLRERVFFWVFDRGPVVITALVAIFLTFMRFGASKTLDSWLGRAHSEPTVIEQLDDQTPQPGNSASVSNEPS